jgi:hypothetical protein
MRRLETMALIPEANFAMGDSREIHKKRRRARKRLDSPIQVSAKRVGIATI